MTLFEKKIKKKLLGNNRTTNNPKPLYSQIALINGVTACTLFVTFDNKFFDTNNAILPCGFVQCPHYFTYRML